MLGWKPCCMRRLRTITLAAIIGCISIFINAAVVLLALSLEPPEWMYRIMEVFTYPGEKTITLLFGGVHGLGLFAYLLLFIANTSIDWSVLLFGVLLVRKLRNRTTVPTILPDRPRSA